MVVWGASCPIYAPDCAYSCLVFHGSATFRMYTGCALIYTYTQPHTLEIAFFLYVAADNARKGPPYLGRICLSPPLIDLIKPFRNFKFEKSAVILTGYIWRSPATFFVDFDMKKICSAQNRFYAQYRCLCTVESSRNPVSEANKVNN